MSYEIMFTANDGLTRMANDVCYDTYGDANVALIAATDVPESEARVSANPLERLATDERVKRMWIRERYVYCNRSMYLTMDRKQEELSRRPAIEQAVDFFRELDSHHCFDHDRLDMTRWGYEGIKEFAEYFTILNNYWTDHDCRDADQMDAYDSGLGGFILFDCPGEVIDPESPEGEEYIKCYKIECTQEIAALEFDERVKEFEEGSRDWSCGDSSGCMSYWVSLWFSPQEKLERLATANWADIRDNAGEILGLTPQQMRVLTTPEAHREVYAHATPGHIAKVLRRYIDTGVITWKDTVERCDDPDCGYCEYRHI